MRMTDIACWDLTQHGIDIWWYGKRTKRAPILRRHMLTVLYVIYFRPKREMRLILRTVVDGNIIENTLKYDLRNREG